MVIRWIKGMCIIQLTPFSPRSNNPWTINGPHLLRYSGMATNRDLPGDWQCTLVRQCSFCCECHIQKNTVLNHSWRHSENKLIPPHPTMQIENLFPIIFCCKWSTAGVWEWPKELIWEKLVTICSILGIKNNSPYQTTSLISFSAWVYINALK